MDIEITRDLDTYRLTTDHATSSYGQPVLVDAAGIAYDRTDAISALPFTDIFGEPYHLTAGMVVAHWAKSHTHEDFLGLDPAVIHFAGLTP